METAALHVMRRTASARQFFSDSLLRNGFFIMMTSVVNAGFGFVYWVLAARSFDEVDVGRASAVIAGLNIATVLSTLGLATVLIDALSKTPLTRTAPGVLRGAQALCVVTAVFSSLVLLVVLPEIVPSLSLGPFRGGAVVLGVTLWVMSILFDHFFLSQRRAELMLTRNTVAAVGKLAALGLLSVVGISGTSSVLVSWVGGLLLGVVFSMSWGYRALGVERSRLPSPRNSDVRPMLRPALMHHLANIGGELPMFLLPLVVIARVGDESGAYFYVTWMVAGIFFAVSGSAASSLFAEGSAATSTLRHATAQSLRWTGGLLLASFVGVLVFGKIALSVFGTNYAEAGYWLLVVLVVSAVPDGLTNVAVARWRVLGRRGHVGILNGLMAVLAVGLTWMMLPHLGIAAVGWAWLVAQTCGVTYVAVVESQLVQPVESSSMRREEHACAS